MNLSIDPRLFSSSSAVGVASYSLREIIFTVKIKANALTSAVSQESCDRQKTTRLLSVDIYHFSQNTRNSILEVLRSMCH